VQKNSTGHNNNPPGPNVDDDPGNAHPAQRDNDIYTLIIIIAVVAVVIGSILLMFLVAVAAGYYRSRNEANFYHSDPYRPSIKNQDIILVVK
jgi:hypothetical protein